ncbi:hypothetical protein NBRC110019_21060 [Neptunitalea chrysea]|uniref:Uncharacterized protein n=1 Tax=Neptunitalea chrysea TaxID=1647581 RepID=A0A9W6B5T5_9FLAO|nr:hypothetical protein NBRC110019_21060 [Neptunitalea chrysea]
MVKPVLIIAHKTAVENVKRTYIINKDEHIVIENSVQTQAFGKSFCPLTVTNHALDFTLPPRSHFEELLFRKNRCKPNNM